MYVDWLVGRLSMKPKDKSLVLSVSGNTPLSNARTALVDEAAIVPPSQPWGIFEQWMTSVKNDTGPGTARDKVLRNKPAAAIDGCYAKDEAFTLIPEAQVFGTSGSRCNTLWPASSNPRRVAGGPLAADTLKCQLRAVSPSDYTVPFSEAERARLNTIFPAGVCDWSKPGVGQTRVVPWASFGPSPDNLTFDITKPSGGSRMPIE